MKSSSLAPFALAAAAIAAPTTTKADLLPGQVQTTATLTVSMKNIQTFIDLANPVVDGSGLSLRALQDSTGTDENVFAANQLGGNYTLLSGTGLVNATDRGHALVNMAGTDTNFTVQHKAATAFDGVVTSGFMQSSSGYDQTFGFTPTQLTAVVKAGETGIINYTVNINAATNCFANDVQNGGCGTLTSFIAVAGMGTDGYFTGSWTNFGNNTVSGALSVENTTGQDMTVPLLFMFNTQSYVQSGMVRDMSAGSPITAVPEPTNWGMMALGLVALGAVARRRQAANDQGPLPVGDKKAAHEFGAN